MHPRRLRRKGTPFPRAALLRGMAIPQRQRPIPGFGEAPAGTLLLDGRSIREYPLSALRRAIGYVPQDTFLFSETLRENIAFGVPDAVENHILEAVEIASISGEIQSFPARYDTMVGERGITPSGGQ